MKDKEFLGNPYEDALFDMVKFSLRYSSSLKEFLSELDGQFQEYNKTARRDAREEEVTR
jgi:hypothetical protein